MIEIIPAILARDERELSEKLAALPRAAEAVHIDFTDSSISPSVEGEYPKGEGVLFEAHLMIPHPQEYIAELVKREFSRILIQIESVSPEVFAEIIHEWRGSVEIAPSLEIETPLEAIDSFAHEIQSVQLMGIAEIGAQGRPFDPRVIPRVTALHAKYPHLTISVDGGVNKENAERLVAAGAMRLVVGSAISEFFRKTTPPPRGLGTSPWVKGRIKKEKPSRPFHKGERVG